MKRITVTAIALLLVSTTLFARVGPPAGGPGGGAPGAPGVVPFAGGPQGGDPLAEYLELTDSQKAAWQAAREELQASTEATREQMKAAHEQMKALMDANSTDAGAIGSVMITIRTLSAQIRAAHEVLETKQQAVLTTDQKAKYAAFQAAAEFLRQRQGPPR